MSAKPSLAPATLLSAGFVDRGIWTFQVGGQLKHLEDMPDGPGVYAFAIEDRVVYAGVAVGGLRRRMRTYVRPGQRKTAGRINREIISTGAGQVRVMSAQPPNMVWEGLPVNGAAGLELGLIQTYDLPWNRRHTRSAVAVAEDEKILSLARDTLFPDISDLSTDEHAKIFCVEAASHYEAPEWAVTRYTNSLQSAKELAHRLNQRFGCVRLFERGIWGRSQIGWIAFWWSDVEYVGDVPQGRGFGIPAGNKKPVTYKNFEEQYLGFE
ncbi:MAG: hypothetical protein ABF479_13005, partial [Gluconacetobacter sp.]|uniref:GIY-YIG domain-containing protein n=1 Tax=Gluconacetobacter dulcium TaxID=2729096 RepID=A0A7W4PFQ7_9PROT|nr:hypothetical protein [Gluconacetobacter dulcium]MBB2196432.1 hypothetical protein [Gluconacetobacter dulcium]